MSQPPPHGNLPTKTQSGHEIKVVDIAVEKCGNLSEDSRFNRVRENINKQKSKINATDDGNVDQQSSPKEAVFFNEDIFEILADFTEIPSEEIYCWVTEGCVEIGAIHKETQGSGPSARHLDIQLTRLYQTPRAINLADVKCYLSSDGGLLVTGSYKEVHSSQVQGSSKKG